MNAAALPQPGTCDLARARFAVRAVGCALLLACVPTQQAQAAIAPERARVEVLPEHGGKEWFWVWGNHAPSQIDGRALLFDGEGRNLGQLNTGFWPNSLLWSQRRRALYSVETYFTRGLRGQRTDVVTRYDPRTLAPVGEIVIPPKRINALGSTGIAVLSDDERFLLALNYTPAQSISIVDLESGKFVGEVETPGCASIYPAGSRDFYSICGNGGFLHLRLDDTGRPVLQQRTARMFDPTTDFLTTAASRLGDVWYFVSAHNNVWALEMKPAGLRMAARWSLVSDKERKEDWRISGIQHTAIHRDTARLYVLMHRGPPESQQEPGTEAWEFDLRSQKRVARIKLAEQSIALGVSQGSTPRLYSIDFFVPMPTLATLWVYFTKGQGELMKSMQQCITVYDVASGKLLRRIDGLPAGYLSVVLPW